MPTDAVAEGDDHDRGFEREEKILRDLECYHGFIPRDDLPFLIRKDGDYLLRVSEVDTTHTNKIKRDIILSLMAENGNDSQMGSVMTCPDDTQQQKPKKTMLRNVVVRRIQQKYSVEADRSFDNLKDLIHFYKENYGSLNKVRFKLRNAVRLQRWELLHNDITIGDLLGEGAFGEVRRGVLKRKGHSYDVAVKLTKGENDLCKEKIKEMMREARLMRNLRHKNIVRLYGVAVDEQPLYIVLELVKGGALNSYLEKNKGHVTLNEKLSMCLGAALGVEFLHKQNIIHRDLAARNCLYSENKVVKISDFGLSRMGKEYKVKSKVKLPIKWLAAETIQKFVFTDKTDAYSFGVMVHEIFADGVEPWDSYNNADVKKMVCEGKVLPMREAPDRVRQFCQERVLVNDSSARAGMGEVVRFFEILTDPTINVDDNKESTKSTLDGKSDQSKSSNEKTDGQKSKYNNDLSKYDKSVADKSIVDKSILEKSVLEKSVLGKEDKDKDKKENKETKEPVVRRSTSKVLSDKRSRSQRKGLRHKKGGFHNKGKVN